MIKTNDTPENDAFVDIDEKEIIKQVIGFSSEKLADVIVMHRYLGLYPTLSTAAMTELATRRTKGDQFNYEEYIIKHLSTLPKLIINVNNVSNLFQKLRKII